MHTLESTRVKKFAYCAPTSLLTSSRIPRIIETIGRTNSDIVCLQELDTVTLPLIEKGIANRLSTAVYSINESLPARDGCGVFYNPLVFQVTDTRSVKLADLLDKHLSSLGNHTRNTNSAISLSRAMYREVREKQNMAIFAQLKHIDSGRELTIVSSHLYWDPAYPDIKLLQAYMLAQESSEISPYQPIVVGADLNSIPQSSGVYELLMGSGKVPRTHPDHPVTIRSSKKGNLEGVSPDAVPDLINPKPFNSAMKLFIGNEPLFTNYTTTFKGCLDYVMMRGDLRVVGGEQLPDESVLAKEVALPNSIYPSDHLPITVDIEFI